MSGTRSTRKQSTGNNARGRNEVETLEDGFVAELADMLGGEKQVLKALQEMATQTQSRRLRGMLEVHTDQTERQIQRLERVFQELNRPARPVKCEGLKGILEEGRELVQKTGPGPVRDAMLVAAVQKVEHYEIASYGTLCAWADQLGLEPALRLLDETLWEEKSMDRNLSWIAESTSNEQADRRNGRDRVGERDSRGSVGERNGRDRVGERDGTDMPPRRGASRHEMKDREMGDSRSRGVDGGRTYLETRVMEQGRERVGRDRQREED